MLRFTTVVISFTASTIRVIRQGKIRRTYRNVSAGALIELSCKLYRAGYQMEQYTRKDSEGSDILDSVSFIRAIRAKDRRYFE